LEMVFLSRIFDSRYRLMTQRTEWRSSRERRAS
jgi:hypothetical protein